MNMHRTFEELADELGIHVTPASTPMRAVVPSTHAPFTRPVMARRPRKQAALCGEKRRAQILTFNGKSLTVREWATRLRVQPQLIHYRLRKRWPIERVLDGKVGPTSFRRH